MISWTAQKRLVVVGSMGPKVGCSLDIAEDFGDEDSWREGMDTVIEAAPELSDEWYAARLAELVDWRDDEEFFRWGGA